MKRHLSTLPFLLLPLCASAAVPRDWIADVSRPSVAPLAVKRGETAALRCTLVRDGKPWNPAAVSATLLWQTNGMGEVWWSEPASVASNVLSATWTPAMDPGASPVSLFIGAADADGEIVYAAEAILRILHAPGAVPSELPLPVRALDFAMITVTNAPWTLASDLAAATNGLLRTESDPTVPAWAKSATKPAYSYTEVGAAAANHSHSSITTGDTTVSSVSGGTATITKTETVLGNLQVCFSIDFDAFYDNGIHILQEAGNIYFRKGTDLEVAFPANIELYQTEEWPDLWFPVGYAPEGTPGVDLYPRNLFNMWFYDATYHALLSPHTSVMFAVSDFDTETPSIAGASGGTGCNYVSGTGTIAGFRVSSHRETTKIVATADLAGWRFDFSTNAGLYLAVSNLVAALGGSVTNFPALP